MKVGIVTFHFAHHYGAQLQAYATMKAFEKAGAESEIIDFRLPHTVATSRLFQKSFSPRSVLSNIYTALHYKKFARRVDRYNAFVDGNMRLSKKRYFSIDELKADTPEYDTYIAGSDQIWNPDIFVNGRLDPVFFLGFTDKRKISYASSFGLPEMPVEMHSELREYLDSFSVLSVREKQGEKIIEEVSGKSSETVLDPTLLLDSTEWSEIAEETEKEPYILCYFLSNVKEFEPYVRAEAKKRGCRVIQLSGTKFKMACADKIVFDAGPKEFLGLFENAEYVFTNSFHGTVFSIQFHKPFCTQVSNEESESVETSRSYNLLKMLGLEERIIGGRLESINWQSVEERLKALRKESYNYIESAIFEEKEESSNKIRLCSKNLCTGCAACANACPKDCIEMKQDKEGFLYPQITGSCIDCGMCMKACPEGKKMVNAPADTAFAVYNKDDAVRASSSSGGVFRALADEIIRRGGVVFGAEFDEDLQLHHEMAESVEMLLPMQGSKYIQSRIENTFRKAKTQLESGKPVLFTGTACQIAGLRGFLGKDYEDLYTCDLVCHGVGSQKVFEGYIKKKEEAYGSRAVDVAFKDKTDGWDKPKLRIDFENGEIYREDYNLTEYGRGYGMQLFLRPACALCEYAQTTRPADFTLGDFWGLGESGAEKKELGVSMVTANSEKGRKMLFGLKDRLYIEQRSIDEATAGNPRLLRPLAANVKRRRFFADLARMPYDEVEKKYLAIPPLHYRIAAKVLSPELKAAIRKIIG